jgi:hypothetical protein
MAINLGQLDDAYIKLETPLYVKKVAIAENCRLDRF